MARHLEICPVRGSQRLLPDAWAGLRVNSPGAIEREGVPLPQPEYLCRDGPVMDWLERAIAVGKRFTLASHSRRLVGAGPIRSAEETAGQHQPARTE